MTKKDYIVCTTISSFKLSYVVPVDSLDTESCDVETAIKDAVTCGDIDGEFSQENLGETIVDTSYMSEAELLERFDRENEYLRDWSKEKKLAWVLGLSSSLASLRVDHESLLRDCDKEQPHE